MSPTLKSSRNGPSVTEAMLAAFARWSGCSDRQLLRARSKNQIQDPHARVDLRVAIRAEHHAVLELLLDSLPAAINTID